MNARSALQRLAAPLFLAICLPGVSSADGPPDGWQISGSNTVRLEDYWVKGDPNAGPYRYTGGQYFDDFNLNLLRQPSPYDSWKGQLFGVLNDSAYRSPYNGLVVERVNLTREKGDGALPYRVEAGDIFAYFSFRTLQRSLKGLQLELQPVPSGSGFRQSVVLVAGVNQPSWRHLDAKDDMTGGLSWLLETDATHGSANIVYDFRQADPTTGALDRRQTVASLAGDHSWLWGKQRLRVDTEVAGLWGDTDGHDTATGPSSPQDGQGRRGFGAFAQASGQSAAGPLDYRLRYERYDNDFRPANAVITPDRESGEAHAGWRFASGLTLRGRVQLFTDAWQSGNDLKTRTYGLNLSGPFLGAKGGLTGSIDAFWQDLRKQDGTIDRGTWNLNANVSKPFPGQWVGTLGLFWQNVTDRVAGAPDTTGAQAQLGATHAVKLGGWNGSITPGISFRRTHGDATAVKDFSPALAFVLSRDRSTVSASYGYQALQSDTAGLANVYVNALRAEYRYAWARNTVGLEASLYDRRVTIGEYNDTYRVSAYWRYSFDRPAVVASAAGPGAQMAPPPSVGPLSRTLALLLDVVPGSDLDATLKRLDEAGMKGGTRQGNVVVFEQRLIGDVTQRQRVGIEHEAGKVKRVGLVVNLDDQGDPQGVTQTYERVRKALLDRLGSASLIFEEGAIGKTLAADLNAGRIIRAMEWQTPNGKLRLGIPRRLDGQVRIEIQHAAAFAPPRDGLWSLEGVR
jgi:hypothetical protein